MIQMFLIKQILKAISRFAKRKIDEKKLKKMHDYVFKANELDQEVVAIWKEIAHLQKDIQIYLDNYYADENIDETLYEELDSRMQVVERFLDTIQTIGNKDLKNLS